MLLRLLVLFVLVSPIAAVLLLILLSADAVAVAIAGAVFDNFLLFLNENFLATGVVGAIRRANGVVVVVVVVVDGLSMPPLDDLTTCSPGSGAFVTGGTRQCELRSSL